MFKNNVGAKVNLFLGLFLYLWVECYLQNIVRKKNRKVKSWCLVHFVLKDNEYCHYGKWLALI